MSHNLTEADKAWIDDRVNTAAPALWDMLAEAIDYGKSRAVDAFAAAMDHQNMQLVVRGEDGDGDAD